MTKNNISHKASVIIPVYNQYESLKKTLKSLSNQTISKEMYEIVIVDDGSSDQLKFETSEEMRDRYKCEIQLYHQKNSGRAVARNTGIQSASNDILVFCDADRVPCVDYIYQHLLAHENGECVVIGDQYDLFYKSIDELFMAEIDWERISRFSRHPNYYSRISKIYDTEYNKGENLYWMSFLVGNASVPKRVINNVGGFDEDFVDWGFEHFELGLRLQKAGAQFQLADTAKNYHIPHKREGHFYQKKIHDSLLLLVQKHPEIDGGIMKKILMENVNVWDYAQEIFYN